MLNSVDVVIPVLNDAAALHGLLVSLRGAAVDPECLVSVYVVDGGSDDESVAVAARFGATVVSGSGGRGPQLATGCRAGSGEWIVMLHADASLQPDALRQLGELLGAQPGVEWGILGHAYDRGGLAAKWAMVSNRLRFHLLGIAFGDQGIFVRRSLLAQLGGVPELPLMEDVELTMRLRRRPRRSLGRCLTASARRFENGGWRYLLKIFCLVSWWLIARGCGADPQSLARRMRDLYYGKT